MNDIYRVETFNAETGESVVQAYCRHDEIEALANDLLSDGHQYVSVYTKTGHKCRYHFEGEPRITETLPDDMQIELTFTVAVQSFAGTSEELKADIARFHEAIRNAIDRMPSSECFGVIDEENAVTEVYGFKPSEDDGEGDFSESLIYREKGF